MNLASLVDFLAANQQYRQARQVTMSGLMVRGRLGIEKCRRKKQNEGAESYSRKDRKGRSCWRANRFEATTSSTGTNGQRFALKMRE